MSSGCALFAHKISTLREKHTIFVYNFNMWPLNIYNRPSYYGNFMENSIGLQRDDLSRYSQPPKSNLIVLNKDGL